MTVTDRPGFDLRLLSAAGLLSLTAMAEMGIVNIALPELATGLSVPIGAAQWAVLAYQIPLALLLIPMGVVLDSRAIRPAVVIAMILFAGTGPAVWITPHDHGLWWVIAMRAVQGASGAALFVLMPVLAVRSAPPDRRATALSVTATLGPLGAVVGPLLGGLVVDAAGWRAAFLVKIPFVLVAAVLLVRSLPAGATIAEAGPAGARPDGDASVLARSVQRVRAIVEQRPLHGMLLGTLGLGAAMQAMQFTLSFSFQGQGWEAARTASVLTVFALVMAATGWFAGRLAERRAPGTVAIAGAVLVTVSLAVLTVGLDRPGTVFTVAVLVVVGFGMGLYGGPTQAWVMSTAPAGSTATAAGAMQLSRTTGFAVGPLIAGLGMTAAPLGTVSMLGATACAGLAAVSFVAARQRIRIGGNRTSPASD
ncbi:MFS transporter [Tsukamurella serpentis]